MELKKNEKYDLEKKRPIFFGIGMIISLSLTLVAFEWKSPIDALVELKTEHDEYTSVIIPLTKIEQPKPPPVKPPIIKETIEEPEIDETPIIDTDTSEDEMMDFVPPVEMPDEKPEEMVRSFAEVMPSYDGGMEKFYKFIGKNVRYPKQAKRMGVEGRVVVQFIVEKDGSLTDIRVLKGIGAGCDEEAIRVMKLVPNFIPGKQGDVRVKVQMAIPINFTLK